MNELQQIAMNELKLHGIKPTMRPNGSGHIEIVWRAVPEKQERVVVVARTPGDWRARMNTRAEVRRYLKADNVQLVVQNKPRTKAKAQLQDAINLPAEIIPIPDQLTALRGEIADLSEMLIKVLKVAYGTREMIAKVLPKEAPAPVKLPSASIKIHEYLSLDRWVSITSLVRDTGLTLKQVKLKLEYLRKQGDLTIHQQSVKLTRQPTIKPRGRKKKHMNGTNGKTLNGHDHPH